MYINRKQLPHVVTGLILNRAKKSHKPEYLQFIRKMSQNTTGQKHTSGPPLTTLLQ